MKKPNPDYMLDLMEQGCKSVPCLTVCVAVEMLQCAFSDDKGYPSAAIALTQPAWDIVLDTGRRAAGMLPANNLPDIPLNNDRHMCLAENLEVYERRVLGYLEKDAGMVVLSNNTEDIITRIIHKKQIGSGNFRCVDADILRDMGLTETRSYEGEPVTTLKQTITVSIAGETHEVRLWRDIRERGGL